MFLLSEYAQGQMWRKIWSAIKCWEVVCTNEWSEYLCQREEEGKKTKKKK